MLACSSVAAGGWEAFLLVRYPVRCPVSGSRFVRRNAARDRAASYYRHARAPSPCLQPYRLYGSYGACGVFTSCFCVCFSCRFSVGQSHRLHKLASWACRRRGGRSVHRLLLGATLECCTNRRWYLPVATTVPSWYAGRANVVMQSMPLGRVKR